MKVYDVEVVQDLDITSGQSFQKLEMNFRFMDGGKEYDCDLRGEAFIKSTVIEGDDLTPPDDEVEFEILLVPNSPYYIYHNGFYVSIHNLDITEDELEDVLKEYCS
jgi:hypothetical protein